MNGSRSTSQRMGSPSYGDRPSLDALNRTIEGLEARIEGLMSSVSRETRQPERPRPAPSEAVSEIIDRQRALNAARERSPLRERAAPSESDRLAPTRLAAEARYQPPQAAAAPSGRSSAAADIAEALVGLRHELKRDLDDGLSREMHALRSEIRGIKAEAAQDRRFAEDVRHDIERLSAGIKELGRQASPAEADALRIEFDDLRSMLEGLAREDSMRRMENRWTGVEDRLNAFDQNRDDELVALAYRLDEIKAQINSLDRGAGVEVLESKLVAVAQAIEMLGRQIQPDERRLAPQFADLDRRLDEISRAIAAGSRNVAGTDGSFVDRLENRLGDLSRQIDTLSNPVDSGLGARIEALAARVEDLAGEKAAARLEERLDQLSAVLEHNRPGAEPDLTDRLADISRKIEALSGDSITDALAERLDDLARRIDGLAGNVEPSADTRFDRLEDRLAGIAQRLEETHAAPFDDRQALRNLEAQIGNLSTLISQSHGETAGVPAEFESRMNTLEDYLATSDEYIIEAARQAAEAVMEAYSRNTAPQMAASTDMAAISALAEDLRTLEELSRSSDERTARTFEALHETLVHIAEKLERLEEREPPASHAPVPKAAPLEAAGTLTKAERDEDVERAAHALAAESETSIHAPVAAAAEANDAAEVAMVEDGEIKVEARAAKTGLLAGLTRRFAPKQNEGMPIQARQMVEPAPSIDPSEMLAPEDANQLLEPGSGVPDVKKILERVRAGQIARGAQEANEGEKADFIAAARRAAQLAVEESDTLNRVKESKAPSAVGGALARHRRPILIAVGAVLLAIMSYPLVSTVLKGKEAPSAPPVAAIERRAEVVEPKAAVDRVVQTAATAKIGEEPRAPAGAEKTDAPAIAAKQPPTQPAAAEAGKVDEAIGGAGDGQAALMRPAEAQAPGPISTLQPSSESSAAEPAKMSEIVLPEGFGPPALVTAAKGGDPLAFYEIGARFTEGRGVGEDRAEAVKWYQRAADAGVVPAEYRLANLYEKGAGVQRDAAKAKALYLKAAAAGNASAIHNLAVMLAGGRDGAPDLAEAAKWFEKAANLGVRDSQFNLAVLYARGDGLARNLEDSYKWFAIAARDGDKDAAEKRDEIAKALKPEELSSAKAKVDAWKAQPLDAEANTVEVPDAWVGPPTKTATVDMTRAVRNIQAILNNNGFDAGKPDGQVGQKTTAAIKAFQKSVGQEPTGEITDGLVRELLKRNS
ncbi:peptidoglycan-binding protein [Sinorhizobium meliloti]|uniref:peptidoglycan-binding protein n=1 Tax=Rhizobium meliloti TaxID=382 RepID=UPI000D1F84B7|nr:peptidoglycan-binding protein [Sinorhizobium meliloti]MDW9416897.1 peptidoglycan-binding protein [Sinorhizobium meliloti]MDW9480242.1 peptidoglycan-binding protein [Sinorhizobium meliloti]MDW9513748.1 peptidoglycan-binding protein [Sinorhizobium meliloti]MDW9851137.1 peptidoglycan-binding protein [Sinorhizobium meliloti]MDW9869982.1 peptidoglycan-binding protein [Sinorhizobium meliloti]